MLIGSVLQQFLYFLQSQYSIIIIQIQFSEQNLL